MPPKASPSKINGAHRRYADSKQEGISSDRDAEKYVEYSKELSPTGHPLAHPNMLALLVQKRAVLHTVYHDVILSAVIQAIIDAELTKAPSGWKKSPGSWEATREDARDFLASDRVEPYLLYLQLDPNWFKAVIRDHTRWGKEYTEREGKYA